MKHLLIVGRPGSGKTTLVKELVRSLRHCPIDGFLTEECREGEQRVGFWLSPLDGRQVLLAHRRLEHGTRVGPYLVNPSVLENVAVPVIRRGVQRAFLLFLDELGKMELSSKAFAPAVQEAFDRGPSIRPLRRGRDGARAPAAGGPHLRADRLRGCAAHRHRDPAGSAPRGGGARVPRQAGALPAAVREPLPAALAAISPRIVGVCHLAAGWLKRGV